ncbi:hypothetical protein PDO_5256, partial [Rhizobium sp. PDO1-076]
PRYAAFFNPSSPKFRHSSHLRRCLCGTAIAEAQPPHGRSAPFFFLMCNKSDCVFAPSGISATPILAGCHNDRCLTGRSFRYLEVKPPQLLRPEQERKQCQDQICRSRLRRDHCLPRIRSSLGTLGTVSQLPGILLAGSQWRGPSGTLPAVSKHARTQLSKRTRPQQSWSPPEIIWRRLVLDRSRFLPAMRFRNSLAVK